MKSGKWNRWVALGIVGGWMGGWVGGVIGTGSLLLTGVASAGAAAPPADETTLFSRLAEQVMPSVVNISATTRGQRAEEDLEEGEAFGGLPGGPSGGMDELFSISPTHPGRHRGGPGPTSMSLGTGFVVDASGIVLTNQHVVAGSDEIRLTLTENPDEVPLMGKVIGRDTELDIALIRIKSERKLVPLAFGDSDALRVGEYVAAVGNPFGQGHSFTHGIISAKGRISPNLPLASYLQTDAPINPGNSGGPLVNLRGEVVGINNAIDQRAQGIGFAIPINVVKAILPELESRGKIARGYLGVVVGELTPELAKKMNASPSLHAPLVVRVDVGGPAYQAGIRPYDIITEFNGKPVHTPSELTSQVTALSQGKTVPVTVSRALQSLDMKVKLTERPATPSRS